jgi:predicted neuraminidase
MDIKTIPLSTLETNLQATLVECADSGQAVVVALPDERLIAIQSLDAAADDSLIDDLLQSNPDFQALVAKSKAGKRKPFPPR